MCIPLNPRNGEIGEEEMEAEDADLTDLEEEDDVEFQAEYDRLQAVYDGFNWDLILVILEFTMIEDIDTEKGLLHVNMVLNILEEEKVLEESWWQLSLDHKKEVFEILLKVDYVMEMKDRVKSDVRIKAIADIRVIICNQRKVKLEECHDVENLEMSESSGSRSPDLDPKVEEADESKAAIEQETEKELLLVNIGNAMNLERQERVFKEKLEQPNSDQEIEDKIPGKEVEEKSSSGDKSVDAKTSK